MLYRSASALLFIFFLLSQFFLVLTAQNVVKIFIKWHFYFIYNLQFAKFMELKKLNFALHSAYDFSVLRGDSQGTFHLFFWNLHNIWIKESILTPLGLL